MLIHLTFIKRSEEYSQAKGKKYERVSIKAREYGDKFISGFGNAGNKNWKEGDEVEVTITPVQKDGKEYLNFSNAEKKSDALDLTLFKAELLTMHGKIDQILKLVTPKEEGPEF